MTGWRALDAELDQWAGEGRIADFWWRDDDAHLANGALRRLLSLAAEVGVPLAVSVVPARIDRELAAAFDGTDVTVLQHGYAHQNLAPATEKSVELGLHRPTPHLLADLAVGRERLESLFGDRLLPVLVPPWNRIAASIVPMLPEIGYRGLSRYKARKRAEPVPGFLEINTHVDIVDWKWPTAAGAGRGLTDARPFVGEERALAAITGHLEARRTGAVDPAEPTGFLTHHLVHGDDAWDFIDAALRHLSKHAAVRWHSARALFDP